MSRIPIAGPSITEREISRVTEAVATGWHQRANVYQERFEEEFAAYVGRRYGVALPSCTSALHLSLASLGVGPGDEVVVPDLTWIASAAPVDYCGATPVFADVDRGSWCISARSLESCVTSRTRAVIVVDLYGNMPDMNGIQDVADRHGVSVVEDAAEAFGSAYHGRPAGSFGAASTFSFHGSKTLTTGEGGMLVTDSEEVRTRALFLRDHGRPPGDRMFFNTEVAFKYKMTAMQAALGLAQLERAEELVQRKRDIAGWYRSLLTADPRLELNPEPPEVRHSYWMSTVVLPTEEGVTKVEAMAALDRQAIDSRPMFHPLSSLPAYAGRPEARRARESNTTAYALAPYGLNLPSGFDMTEERAGRVAASLLGFIAAQEKAEVVSG